MKTTEFLYILGLLLCIALPGQSQGTRDWEKNDQKSMESMVFDVVGDKEIRLSQAARLYDPIPPQPYQRINPNLSYSFNDYFYSAEPIVLRLRPRPVAAQPEEKLYGNYIKGGIGNYGTPYADLFLSNKRQREFSYGAKFNYLSSLRGSVDGRNSGAGRLNTGVFGSAFGEKATLSGSVFYSRDDLHFYGYPDGTDVTPKEIKQSFNRIDLEAGIANTKVEDDFQYRGTIKLKNISDHFDAKETALNVGIVTTLQVMDNAWMHIDGGITTVSRNDPNFSGDNRLHFFGQGGLRYLKDKLTLKAMIRVDYVDDTLASGQGTKVYPIVALVFKMSESIIISGGIDGGIEMATWNAIAKQNPFISSGQYIAASNKQLGINGRIDVAASSKLGISGGFKYSRIMNSHYFINSVADQSRFDVVYDSGIVNLFNPFAAISFNRNEEIQVGMSADYFGYSMGFLENPWHTPTYKLGINGSALIVEKIRLTSDIYFLGGIKASDAGAVKELDSIVDVNLGVEYIAGSRLSFFINSANLLGKKYMIYNNYPVKGVQVIGGLSYKF